MLLARLLPAIAALVIFTPTECLTPGNSSYHTSAISPIKKDAEAHLNVTLAAGETIDTVTWFRNRNLTSLLAVHQRGDNSESHTHSPSKYEAHVEYEKGNAKSVHLHLTIINAFDDENRLAHEGAYFAMVTLTSPHEAAEVYTVYVELHIATRLSLEFSPVRKVGSTTTIRCIAKGWKPKATFSKQPGKPEDPNPYLLAYGVGYDRDTVLSEFNISVATEEKDGTFTSTATTRFNMSNMHRGVSLSCSAWNAATGKATPFKTNQTFHETQIHKPQPGEDCLWPPSTSTPQCFSDEFKAGLCLHGVCNDLYGAGCFNDDDCGHDRVSRLQCLKGRCSCNDQVFDLVTDVPYCKHSVGQFCGPATPCNNSLTVRTEGTCQCDLEISNSTIVEVRNVNYTGCAPLLGESCTVDTECGSTNASQMVCNRGKCVCKEGTVSQKGRCISVSSKLAALLKGEEGSETKSQSPENVAAAMAIVCGCFVTALGPLVYGKRQIDQYNERIRRYFPRKGKLPSQTHTEVDTAIDQNKNAASTSFAPPLKAVKHLKRARSVSPDRMSVASVLRFQSAGQDMKKGPNFGESSVFDFGKLAKQMKKQKAKAEKTSNHKLVKSKTLPLVALKTGRTVENHQLTESVMAQTSEASLNAVQLAEMSQHKPTMLSPSAHVSAVISKTRLQADDSSNEQPTPKQEVTPPSTKKRKSKKTLKKLDEHKAKGQSANGKAVKKH